MTAIARGYQASAIRRAWYGRSDWNRHPAAGCRNPSLEKPRGCRSLCSISERRRHRFYFASEYRSWHGSPSRDDSEIPLIVANHHYTAAQISEAVRRVLGKHPYQQKVTDLMLGIQSGAFDEP